MLYTSSLLLLAAALVHANPLGTLRAMTSTTSMKRSQCGQVAYHDPRINGGSMLDASAGLGEPLNVIISGLSSPDVLDATGKFYNYANAMGFSWECLGLHLGDPQQANLGDGRGWVNETAVLREDYGNPDIGTCGESLLGGNHFRIYIQEDTCALFLAVSREENVSQHHTIAPNGYNVGRDELVASALNTDSFDVNSPSGLSGLKEFDGVKYKTTAKTIEGLLQAGKDGINHGIAIDGKVVLLTVEIV